MTLASDNPHLSDPRNLQPDTPTSPRRQALGVEHYVRAATAKNTRRAHASDLRQFLAWGGTISGHSLRAGLVTSAVASGVPGWAIRKVTGHRSEAMLNRYIRLADAFKDVNLEWM